MDTTGSQIPGDGQQQYHNNPAADVVAEASRPVREAADDPHRLANSFIRPAIPDDDNLAHLPALRYWRGDWFEFAGGCYQRLDPGDLRAELTRHVKAEADEAHRRERLRLAIACRDSGGTKEAIEKAADTAKPPFRVTEGLLSSVLNALKSMVTVPSGLDDPSWLPGTKSELAAEPASELLVFPNCVYSPSRHRIGESTPELWTTRTLGAPLEWDAQTPARWMRFLGEIWPDDPDSVRALQQYMGYCLTSGTRFEKLLFLLGPVRSGKGSILQVIEGLVGEASFAAPTLASLGERFGLEDLIGKRVAGIGDARFAAGGPAMAATVERLLSVSAGDALNIQRKFKGDVVTRLSTKIVIASNELPRLRDASAAVVSRVLLLRLTKSFKDEEDATLKAALLGELAGIMAWAVRGLCDLRASGRLLQPETGREALQQMTRLSSSVQAFLEDMCHVASPGDPNINEFRIPTTTLHAAWQKWCKAQGTTPSNREQFGKDLVAAAPSVTCKLSRYDKHPARCFVGVTLRERGSQYQ